jgi:hypothetical protein
MKVKELLLSNNYWVLNKKIVKSFGALTALFLTALAEAEDMFAEEDGWFFQTIEEIENLTGITKYSQNKIISELEKQGILNQTVRGIPAKRYFKLNYEKIENSIFQNQQINIQKSENQFTEIGKSVCRNQQTSFPKSENYFSEIGNNKEHINKETNKEHISKNENLDFVPTEYLDIIKLWLDYKKERKQMYASATSLKVMVNRLIKLSHNNPQTAREIIEESIANNYSGFFELKSYKNENKKATVGIEPTKDAKYDDGEPF